MILTSTQKQYIKEHPTDSPYAMARKFGCAEQTVYYWLHIYHGCSFIEAKKAEKEHRKNVIRELYPTTSAPEIGNMLGITKSAVNNIARRLGVRHTEETKKRLFENFINESRKKETQEKRISAIREMIKREKRRFVYGLPQKTKRKFSFTPKKNLHARNNLCSAYNYFYNKDYGDLLTIFYDSETSRLPVEREEYYTKRYGIQFREADI